MPGEPPAYNWNEKWPASIATDTGPTSDTTSFRADSLPLFTPTHPLTVAATLVLSNTQGCCCNTIMIWSHFALNHLIFFNPKYQLEKKIFSPPKMKKNVPYIMITFVITFIANVLTRRNYIRYYYHHRKTEYTVFLLFVK